MVEFVYWWVLLWEILFSRNCYVIREFFEINIYVFFFMGCLVFFFRVFLIFYIKREGKVVVLCLMIK